MNFKAPLLSVATAAALALASASKGAILGVPSEGLLVPFGVQGSNANAGTSFSIDALTGVLIETPALVGADTITNDYTAPSTTKGGYVPPEVKGEWKGGMTVHYYMFDDKSEHVYDSTFVMSPDDLYFWVPPPQLFDYGSGGRTWIGYVVFADDAARTGGPATFVMSGQAGIALYLGGTQQDIIDVPVVPLADGDDAAGIRIGNEITYSKQQLPRIDDVVPLVAGTRYSGAPGATTTIVTGLVPFDLTHIPLGLVAHVMWFSENGMHADIDYCDDEEWCVSCRDWTFNEVNMLWYAASAFQADAKVAFFDGIEYLEMSLTCTSPEECNPVYESLTFHDVCGAESAGGGPADAPGTGIALYELANIEGVVGVNFQIGTTGPGVMTAPMLGNGQF